MGETAKLSEQKQRSTGGLKWLREHKDAALPVIHAAGAPDGKWGLVADKHVAKVMGKFAMADGIKLSPKSVEAFRHENGMKSFERTRSVEVPPPAADTVVDETPQDYLEEPEPPHFVVENPIAAALERIAVALEKVTAK